MDENEKKLAELRKRVEDIARYQDYFVREMTEIRRLIAAIETGQNPPAQEIKAPVSDSGTPVTEVRPPIAPKPEPTMGAIAPLNTRPDPAPDVEIPSNMFGGVSESAPRQANLEKFIGGNLIAKIGVVITVIGVAIGARYAIDRGWITPVMRIVFGYLIGISLLVPAYRLRDKFEKFSAVTLSGAMAIFYFISYAAYSFYGLIPQSMAFALMVVFTAFTVVAAIRYNRVIIAHIGMVGAYAVPFLLSENEGRVAILFSYMLIINAGILAVSIARYWRSLFYSSFAITWLIFHAWYAGAYNAADHFSLAFGFAAAFFAVFYATFIAWKLIANEPFGPENVVLVLANSFIFFGVGYSILNSREELQTYSGIFAIGNAAVHFLVAAAIHRNPKTAPSVVNLIVGLVIVFITVAVPIQLKGHWITLVWIVEAAVLFTIGRTKRIALYEWFSYPLMVFGTGSLFVDWIKAVDFFRASDVPIYPLINAGFMTNLIFIAAGVLILFVGRRVPEGPVLSENWRPAARILIGLALGFVIYNTFRMEIGNYWDYIAFKEFDGGEIIGRSNGYWNAISQIDYSLLFVAAAIFLNRRWLRSQSLALVTVLLSGLFLLIFITAGFSILTELRGLFMRPDASALVGPAAIGVRYLTCACAGLLLWGIGRSAYDAELPSQPVGNVRSIGFHAVLNVVVLACLSSELLNLTDLAGIADAEKLGLSILWGLYALALIGIGIARAKKHLRVGALALFGMTLIKLFFYDLADLGTIAKTVVFVSLGLLLLIAGYFYNRYESVIFKSDET